MIKIKCDWCNADIAEDSRAKAFYLVPADKPSMTIIIPITANLHESSNGRLDYDLCDACLRRVAKQGDVMRKKADGTWAAS